MLEAGCDQVWRERIDVRPIGGVAIEPGFEETELGFGAGLFEAAVDVGGDDAVLKEFALPELGAEAIAIGGGPGLERVVGVRRDGFELGRADAAGVNGFLEEALGGCGGGFGGVRFEGFANSVQ